MTRATVTVQTASRGLCFLQPNPKMATSKLNLMASGVMDVYPNKPFNVLVANFSHQHCTLSRNWVVGYAIDAPTGIVTPSLQSLRKAGDIHQPEEGGCLGT